jgi:hypothetical protein
MFSPMKTATLSLPPRPPRDGHVRSGLGEPDGEGSSGRSVNVLRWCLKFAVIILLVIAVAQLALIMFQTVRLWFFS